MKWVILGSAILAEVSGSLALKAAVDQPLWYAWVAVGYLVSIFLLDRGLRLGLPLGVAYGIWAATGVALTAVLANFIFGEALTGLMGLGIVLIMGGVLLVEFGSHPPEAKQEVA
ncbi:MAG: QacE family quaternary ammonium compound efflux SMR transporter [Candidatus Nanopelagicales bacterium]|nr:QacE family quaternary ammonium compound efflux SMR transporter [Candidatus Nanopelagicales bacterium]MCF8551136.1 QacE family quaternary ammonium compound efflux SMR transporter [Candidatus Nanopelagicales bacterium]